MFVVLTEMTITSRILILLTISSLTATFSQGIQCFNCTNCNTVDSGTRKCTGALCLTTTLTKEGQSKATRTCVGRSVFVFNNLCREWNNLPGGMNLKFCQCNTELCNTHHHQGMSDTKRKQGVKCYTCNNCELQETVATQCGHSFDSCLTITELDKDNNRKTSKACSSGLDAGCQVSGSSTMCACKEDFCNKEKEITVKAVLETSLETTMETTREKKPEKAGTTKFTGNDLSGSMVSVLVVLAFTKTVVDFDN